MLLVYLFLFSGENPPKTPIHTVQLLDNTEFNQIQISQILKPKEEAANVNYLSAAELFNEYKDDANFTAYIYVIRSLLLESVRSLRGAVDLNSETVIKVEFIIDLRGEVTSLNSYVMSGRIDTIPLNQRLLSEFRKRFPFPVTNQQKKVGLPILFEFEIAIS